VTVTNLAKRRKEYEGQSRVGDKKAGEFKFLWLFVDHVPVDGNSLVRALSDYAEDHWERAPAYGQISIKEGKTACR
jgi:hypothetical protein